MKIRARQRGRPRLGPVLVAILSAAAVAGCGGGSSALGTGKDSRPSRGLSNRRSPTPGARGRTNSTGSGGRGGSNSAGSGSRAPIIPTPGPTGIPAAAGAVRVIRAWSTELRRGNVQAAARYFALPSVMINGPDQAGGIVVITIRSRAEAVAANATLPCGAAFISADQRGLYVNALFRLTNRPGLGGGCATGIGLTARTNLVIRNGLIVKWIRAPDDPGDNGSGAPPPSSSGPPTSSPVD